MRLKRRLSLVLATALSALTAMPIGAASANGESADPIDWTQLRQTCLQHPDEAASVDGWAPNRFELCHSRYEKVNLYKVTGEYLGWVDFDFLLLSRADYGSRRVDMQASLESVHQENSLNENFVHFTLRIDNCSAAFVTCTGGTYREANIRSWYDDKDMDPILATSSNNAGASPYFTAGFSALAQIKVEYLDGRTIPWDGHLANVQARFDSAGSPIGSAPTHGAVLLNRAPTMLLDKSATSTYRSQAAHVYDALHRTYLTFPSFVGKNVPGVNRPLHRLMGTASERNNTEAVKVCVDVWGTDYKLGGLQCDEYPFKSTYEGAAFSTSGVTCENSTPTGDPNWRIWNGSARPIDGDENREGGTVLGTFYRTNRMIDCDPFYLKVQG